MDSKGRVSVAGCAPCVVCVRVCVCERFSVAMSHVSTAAAAAAAAAASRGALDAGRQQMLRVVSWDAASSSIVNHSSSLPPSSSSSSSSSAAAAVNYVDVRRYDAAAARLRLDAARPPPYQPNTQHVGRPTADPATRWNQPPPPPPTPYPPPPISFRHPSLNGWSSPEMGGYRGASSGGGGGGGGGGGCATLCHVDPAVRGACVACDYIRHSNVATARRLRYHPYNATRRKTPPNNSATEPRRVSHY